MSRVTPNTLPRWPKTWQATNLTGAGAMDGAFWGMLFGLIFFMPFVGGGKIYRDICDEVVAKGYEGFELAS